MQIVFLGDDEFGQNVRKVDTAGIVHAVAGTGVAGFSGDGGVDTAAELHDPAGVATDACGNLYICDLGNDRIRKVTFNPNCSDTTTSVANIANNSTISVYPNPATTELTITGSNIKSVQVINMLGQVVYNKAYNSKQVQVNIINLLAGLYYVKVNEQYVQKIIKE